MTELDKILNRTFFILIYCLPGPYRQLRERETIALHLEEALERTNLDRSHLVEAYMKVESGFFPLLLEGKAIEAGVLEEYGGHCFYCGAKVFDRHVESPLNGNPKDRTFEIEHKIPRSRGGNSVRSNLVCTCSSCNRLKGGLNVEEFRLKMQRRADPESQVVKHLKKALEISPNMFCSESIAEQIKIAETKKYPWKPFYGELINESREQST